MAPPPTRVQHSFLGLRTLTLLVATRAAVRETGQKHRCYKRARKSSVVLCSTARLRSQGDMYCCMRMSAKLGRFAWSVGDR